MKLEEIRGLLEKATPGPWTWDIDKRGSRCGLSPLVIRLDDEYPGYPECGSDLVMDFEEESDAALIAAAPELATLLVRAVEALEDQIERDGICLVDPPCGDCAACRSRSLLRELGVEA